jgi:hypothetical protein
MTHRISSRLTKQVFMSDNLNNFESQTTTLARIALVSFLLTFILARLVVFLIILREVPDFFLYIGDTHIHHLNYGIFLLAAVGGYLLLKRPAGKELNISACLYGIGLALTFDEFGMWLHLGGSYWQRASWDAVIVLTAILALIAFAPSLKRFHLRHWLIAALLVILAVIFFILLTRTFHFTQKLMLPFHLHTGRSAF